MKRLGILCATMLALAGCGDDDAPIDSGMTMDAGPIPDAPVPDTGPGPDTGPDAGPASVCGDGTQDTGEECDDGNTENGDGCDSTCSIEPPTCMDGTLNQDETDVDCGGVCGASCMVGQECAAGGDCTTDLCTMEGICLALPTCDDGLLNGMESDLDCGGMMCAGCTTDGACRDAMDCAEGVCGMDGLCAAPVCGDGIINGTDVCDGDDMGTGGETAACNVDCTATLCGDDYINTAGEDCEDGNAVDGDGCSSACLFDNDITLAGTHVFDTDTGEMDGVLNTGWDGTSLSIGNLDIPVGATLQVTGTQPLNIIARGDVVIAGDLDASGQDGEVAEGCDSLGAAGGLGGPGGGSGGNGGPDAALTSVDGLPGTGPGGGLPGLGDDAGGGGAGHLIAGTDGVADGTGTGGAGGVLYMSLPPLVGGSGGGGGSADDDDPAGADEDDDGGGGGGGGGGAVSIDAQGFMLITGILDVSGGAGAIGDCSSGAGGGGSGGVIALTSVGSQYFGPISLNITGGLGSTDGAASGDGSDGRLSTIVNGACGNGMQDGDETDVDCGGSCGSTCDFGGVCTFSSDCSSLACDAGLCVSCSDGVMNAEETDVDCGGPACGATCSLGDVCILSSDCGSLACDTGLCVSCSDGAMNAEETDVDCGGPACGGCSGGQGCTGASDCLSTSCTMGVCDPGLTSCAAYLAADPASVDGLYAINAGGADQVVLCDMTTDMGGWTLVSSTNDPVDDLAQEYSTNLTTLEPSEAMLGVWNGMRPVTMGTADVRFTCQQTAGAGNDVDLSFYAVDFYDTITTGPTDADSCFFIGGVAVGVDRTDNVAGVTLPASDLWDNTLESEDSCGDTGDFTIDFDDRGMDSDQSDGTDWGEDDGTRKCGLSSSGEAWQIWVRE